MTFTRRVSPPINSRYSQYRPFIQKKDKQREMGNKYSTSSNRKMEEKRQAAEAYLVNMSRDQYESSSRLYGSMDANTKPWEVNASGVVGRNPYKRAMMADLVTTAKLYYDKSSWEVRKSAHDFFDSLDRDNDGKVSLHEFLGCMRELGHFKMGSRHFFNELDKDMNGTLEFMEVMALYYIIKSGRPFCSGCDEFIPGMYFSCSVCFENGNNLFCVCPSCFQGGNFNHKHHQFLDNFALLEAKRIQYKPISSVTIAELEELPTSTSNAVGPYNQTPPPRYWKHAWKALEMALNAAFSAAAGAAATVATQAGSCTIM